MHQLNPILSDALGHSLGSLLLVGIPRLGLVGRAKLHLAGWCLRQSAHTHTPRKCITYIQALLLSSIGGRQIPSLQLDIFGPAKRGRAMSKNEVLKLLVCGKRKRSCELGKRLPTEYKQYFVHNRLAGIGCRSLKHLISALAPLQSQVRRTSFLRRNSLSRVSTAPAPGLKKSRSSAARITEQKVWLKSLLLHYYTKQIECVLFCCFTDFNSCMQKWEQRALISKVIWPTQ